MGDVPPTQYLAMEVLAARWRQGHSTWTFPSSCRSALRALADRGWVGHKSGVIERTERAWLTVAGCEAWALDQPDPTVSVSYGDQNGDAGAPSVSGEQVGQDFSGSRGVAETAVSQRLEHE